jgi:hypothetical protein
VLTPLTALATGMRLKLNVYNAPKTLSRPPSPGMLHASTLLDFTDGTWCHVRNGVEIEVISDGA